MQSIPYIWLLALDPFGAPGALVLLAGGRVIAMAAIARPGLHTASFALATIAR